METLAELPLTGDQVVCLSHEPGRPQRNAIPRISLLLSSGAMIVVRQRFFGMFWPLFLAGSERLGNNRRMTDAAHNQHSETRRPSDRDRIATTWHSRFRPARPEVLR